MAEPMTIDHARRLAAQDCPLPSLAGPALRLLLARIDELERPAAVMALTYLCAGEIRAIGEQMQRDGKRLQAKRLTTDELVAIGSRYGWRLTPHLEPIDG